MSKDKPIFGLDISEFQRGLSLANVSRQDYKFVCIRATGGLNANGSIYRDREYAEFSRQAKAAGLIQGAYLFLVEKPASQQVDVFMDVVGSLEGKLLMLDFEAYEPNRNFDPQNHTLKEVVAEFRRRGVRKPILVYSGQGYWLYGKPSGPLASYGDDLIAWDAFYPLGSTSGFGSTLYERCKGRGWGKRWGGVEPHFWQFTGTGRVSGYSGDVDINAYAGTLEELKALTRAPYAPEHPDICPTCGQRWPGEPHPPSPPEPPEPETLSHGVRAGTNFAAGYEYVMSLNHEMPYEVWTGGPVPSGPMAYAINEPPPPIESLRSKTIFCAGVPNLFRRVAGKVIPSRGRPNFDGGVAAYWYCPVSFGAGPLGPGYFRNVEQRFNLATAKKWAKESGSGVLVGRSYTGATLAGQGHVAILLPDGKVLQSFLFGSNGEPGLNDDHTIEESHAGGFYQHMVHPKDWINLDGQNF